MGKTALGEKAVGELAQKLRGNLISREDAGYDEARKVYNAMIDKRPLLIARCVDAADVVAAVNFGRANDLAIAVRGGGHNGAGLGTCDDGLVIDLGRMRGIRVDPQKGTVRVQGGATWGDVDHATHAYGLAVPAGFLSTTGVGGLTLGGGVGYLTGRYGLTIDNLLGVDMVLADGSLVTADASQNAELFWAVRGGGGNFGVITSFLFQGRPVSTVYGGPIFWELEDAPRVMRFWRDLILSEPQDLNAWLGFHTVPPVDMFPKEHHLKKMLVAVWCYTGDPEKGKQVFEPIRNIAPPAIDYVGPIPFPALNSMFDWVYPAGLQWYWSSEILDRPERQGDRHGHRLRLTAAEHALDHASVSDQRRCPSRGKGRYRLEPPRRQLCPGDGWRRSGPGKQPAQYQVGERLPAIGASTLFRGGIRQHDDGRGDGPSQDGLRRPLRTPGADQGQVRPAQPVPRQPERKAGVRLD